MRFMHGIPDLDLLVLFDALYAERHLTRAAARAGRSQPAMSRALVRMRTLFGDALFVRTATGMVPTPRADALAPEVKRVLGEARSLVRKPRFVPAELERSFVIGTTDLVEAHLLSPLVELVAREALRVDVTTRNLTSYEVSDLVEGRVDMFIAPQANVPDGLMMTHLFEDTFLVAVRKDHPELRGRRLTLERFVALRHVQIAPRGLPGGVVDDALASRGLARRVAVRTPSFLTAPLLVARSDLVLTAPKRMLEQLAPALGLRTFPLPFPVPGFRIVCAWHPRVHADPSHRWFRGLVVRACG